MTPSARSRFPLAALAVGSVLLLGCNDRKIALTDTPDYQVQDLRSGNGPLADYGDEITAKYTVSLPDGTEIVDITGSKSHTWTIGDGTVIAGVDEAVIGMRQGGHRRVVIPPDLHYGEAGYGGVVPPNTSLTMEIWLLTIR